MTEREPLPGLDLTLDAVPPGRISDDLAATLLLIRWRYAQAATPLSLTAIYWALPELPKTALVRRLRLLKRLGQITWQPGVAGSIRPVVPDPAHADQSTSLAFFLHSDLVPAVPTNLEPPAA